MTRFATIDAYIAAFPKDIQAILKKIRATIRRAAPGAEEVISYNIPTFRRSGGTIHFAAFKAHIGLYPPVRDRALQSRTRELRGPKDNLQFPLSEPMPYALIADIARNLLASRPEKPATKARAKAAKPKAKARSGRAKRKSKVRR